VNFLLLPLSRFALRLLPLVNTLANWIDQWSTTNVLPRMLGVFLWNMAILSIFLYLYWMFWVWFRALISGTNFNDSKFLKTARIVYAVMIALNFLAEAVCRQNSWLLLTFLASFRSTTYCYQSQMTGFYCIVSLTAC